MLLEISKDYKFYSIRMNTFQCFIGLSGHEICRIASQWFMNGQASVIVAKEQDQSATKTKEERRQFTNAFLTLALVLFSFISFSWTNILSLFVCFCSKQESEFIILTMKTQIFFFSMWTYESATIPCVPYFYILMPAKYFK